MWPFFYQVSNNTEAALKILLFFHRAKLFCAINFSLNIELFLKFHFLDICIFLIIIWRKLGVNLSFLKCFCNDSFVKHSKTFVGSNEWASTWSITIKWSIWPTIAHVTKVVSSVGCWKSRGILRKEFCV